MKKELITAVYFAKQRGFKDALISIDYYGGECASVLAKWYLEDVSFVENSLRNYNKLMRRERVKEAFEIVDRLKDMGLLF